MDDREGGWIRGEKRRQRCDSGFELQMGNQGETSRREEGRILNGRKLPDYK